LSSKLEHLLPFFAFRDALKHFPSGASKEGESDDGGGGGSGDDVAEPGCCSLCERLMPLTRHHVMPKWVLLVVVLELCVEIDRCLH